MYKSSLWRHLRRALGAIQDKEICCWTTALRGFAAILFLLATGGWSAPVAVVAAPSTPADGATFDITWSTNCETPPPEAVTALDYATSLWGTWISSTVPVEVSTCWTPNLSVGDALGTGMPTKYVSNFPGTPLVDTMYPIALANALSRSDLNPAGVDMVLEFKSDITWSFALTPTHRLAPADGEDFVTIALHELAHGLGFVGNMVVEYNIGFCGNSLSSFYCPTPYDRFVVDGNGVALLDYLTPDPRVLGARLKSDANFGGPNTIAANEETTAKLYTPAIWYPGSSLSHLDQGTFEAGLNNLMTPYYDFGATRHPGPVTLGIMQDMGWLRADGGPNVVTSGPRIVGVGSATPFTGTLLWDGYTGQPITYTWTAEGQTLVRPGLAKSDTVTLTWDTPGEKVLTLTATDADTQASATRAILAFAASVTGPTAGKTNHAYTFTADVTLGGYPATYTWEATGQAPTTLDSVTFTWPVSGTQTITVTAVIEGAPTQAVHTITIEETVYHFIYLPLIQRQ